MQIFLQPHKWIIPLFIANSGCTSMPGIHDSFIRQGIEFVHYGFFQILKTTAGKICAPDAAGKERISAYQHPGSVQTNAAHSMAWRVKNSKCGFSQVQNRAFRKLYIHWIADDLRTQPSTEVFTGIYKLHGISRMDADRCTGFAFQVAVSAYVICMTMGVDDVFQIEFVLL